MGKPTTRTMGQDEKPKPKGTGPKVQKKTLKNTDVDMAKKNVSGLKVFGDGDVFKLLSKASSEKEDWMKSTKVMEIPGAGCLVQVTTQQGDRPAEALAFVPGTRLEEVIEGEPGEPGYSVKRRILNDVRIG